MPNRHQCQCGCGREGMRRSSMGIFAGYWCAKGWANSGYRKVGREGFDPSYAGENYEEDY